MNRRDTERRRQVAEILGEPKNLCPVDPYRAAAVFQHGRRPNDFLFAHVLASAAAVRGREPVRWMSAATLDRYLTRVGQAADLRYAIQQDAGRAADAMVGGRDGRRAPGLSAAGPWRDLDTRRKVTAGRRPCCRFQPPTGGPGAARAQSPPADVIDPHPIKPGVLWPSDPIGTGRRFR